MIVDLILDRKDDDELIKQGFTHAKYWDGRLRPLAYDPKKFYDDLVGYIVPMKDENGNWTKVADPDCPATKISRAMDSGTEQDVKDALCAYITNCNYNPEICDYINSRNWLTKEGEDAA